MVRLSLAIARRVLRRELAVDPDAMHGLVLGALEKLQSQEICRVSGPSVARRRRSRAYLKKAVPGPAIEVIADPAREPGAVIFETDRGNLDASVDSQLQEIERGLDRPPAQTVMNERVSLAPYFDGTGPGVTLAAGPGR